MTIYLVGEVVEGLNLPVEVNIPKYISNKGPYLGPAGQIYRGIQSARRVTESNSPIVWVTEGVPLLLDATGNHTSAMLVRTGVFLGSWVTVAIAPDPLSVTIAMSATNNLLERQSTA